VFIIFEFTLFFSCGLMVRGLDL